MKAFLKVETHLIQVEIQQTVCSLSVSLALSQHTLFQDNLNKHRHVTSGGGEILNGMQLQLAREPGLRLLVVCGFIQEEKPKQ